ncbi:hypothetical protein KAR91_86790 [Candidatus Pacearchaeota archaeon]|nr:hypothetical protein [Candidatus Pacearchaeota archaeon]
MAIFGPIKIARELEEEGSSVEEYMEELKEAHKKEHKHSTKKKAPWDHAGWSPDDPDYHPEMGVEK